MNKKILALPFLTSLFFLNTGFIFKPKLRAFYCGGEYQLVKSNQELLKQEQEILIFDYKGNLYQYDYFFNRVSPYQLKVIDGVEFRLIKSFIEDSKFHMNYRLSYDSYVGTAKVVLDYDRENVNGEMIVNGEIYPLNEDNCKEIKFPKDTKFEY